MSSKNGFGADGPLGFDAVRWLTPEIVRTVHDATLTPETIAGEDGVRPIEAVLGGIEQRAHYEDFPLDVVRIGATYAVAIARAHAFIDGNKRTALGALVTFLELHGYALVGIDQPGLADLMERVAAGQVGEEELGAAVAPHVEPFEGVER